MKYVYLGNSGIKVSELCFGVLPIGPLQANLSVEEGGNLILKGLHKGINFLDTAEVYKTYDYIKYALERFEGDVVVCSKSMASDYKGMEKSILDALKSLNREYIDIFLLHAARETPDVFEKREEALRCLLEYKQKGYIRAIGISTHSVKVVERASKIPELDVVFPLINKAGRGVLQGSKNDMLKAIKKCSQAGQGLFAMKVLAGGNLVNDLIDAIEFSRNIEGIDAVAIGMVNEEELNLNLKIFNNEIIEDKDLIKTVNTKKIFIYERHCQKCGACIKTCPNHALSMGDNSAIIDHNKCILCGYCSPVCEYFAIRML
ncbi:MAG: 4Fe-4S binding protein [Clostridia bacterium]|nr:4Fe-4S binding protein [Clostridia bacterium]